MRPRDQALLVVGGFTALAVLMTILAPRRLSSGGEPRSTYLPGPDGARGLADALGLLGVPVYRYRRTTRQLGSLVPFAGDTSRAPLVAFLAPSIPLSAGEGSDLSAWVLHGGQLLLAGPSAATAMRCFGFEVEARGDSIAAVRPGEGVGQHPAEVTHVLAPTGRTSEVTPVDPGAGVTFTCRVPRAEVRDTLLVTTGQRLEAIRIGYSGGGSVTFVAEGGLFANRSVRYTAAGPEMLSLLSVPGRSVYFDEYHHGFDAGGSLSDAVLAWSRRSPWGWGAWQVAVVGLLALLVAAIRFGPKVPLEGRQRRSPIEHVRALATALAAARGHDVAVRAMVGGLRRRLSRDGRPSRQPVEEWLSGLAARVRGRRAQDAVKTLRSLITPPQPATAVLQAANAVEDVWQELKP